MDISLEEKKAWSELAKKTSIWLNKNFYKFSQGNKIRIAIEVFKRRNQPIPDDNGEDWVKYPMRLIPATGNGHGREEALEKYKGFIRN